MDFKSIFQSRKKKTDINDGVKEAKKNGALLVDVREKEEYESGHIPSSVNIPLSEIQQAGNALKDKHQKIALYCQSGMRAERAKEYLTAEGYSDVENLGGIMDYRGPME